MVKSKENKCQNYFCLITITTNDLVKLFRAIFSFCLMLARDFSCAMSQKFVQCWRGICSNRLLLKKLLVPNKNLWKGMLFRRQCTRVYSCAMLTGTSFSIAQGFYLWNVVPIVLQQHWIEFFQLQCCLESLEQHCTKSFFVESMSSQEY